MSEVEIKKLESEDEDSCVIGDTDLETKYKLSSRPSSCDLKQPTCLSDYDKYDIESGRIRIARIKKNLERWKSQDSLLKRPDSSQSVPDLVTKKSSSMNSVFSTGVHKSMLSLTSREDSGQKDFNPVVVEDTICRSYKEQRKHLKKKKLFCFSGCASTCSLDRFRVLGCGLFLVGALLCVGFWNYCIITSSLNHVEGVIPTYVYGAAMIVSGICTIFASKRTKPLIILILILSFVCTVFCVSSFVYLVTRVSTRLGQLDDCSFDGRDNICSCVIQKGDTKKVFHFAEVMNCHSVKESLRELVYGVSALFGVGFVISVLTASAACCLLHKEKRKQKYRVVQNAPGSINSTTQTQESCFTSGLLHSFGSLEYHQKAREDTTSKRTVHSVNNFSVSTQTPLFMMPVAEIVDAMNTTDYQLDLFLDGCDEPPPSYNDAIASLLS